MAKIEINSNIEYLKIHVTVALQNLHVIDVEVLLYDGCGLLLRLVDGQRRLGRGLLRWGRGSSLPLH